MFIGIAGKRSNQGFSMIELLVTMLVFAVGILGIASMQTAGLRLAKDAELVGKANILASSMADRMRGNIVFTSGYAGEDGAGVDGSDRSCLDEGSETPDSDCTPEQEELIQWNEEIATVLPNGKGIVTFSDPLHTISITWTETQDSNQTNKQRTYDLVVRL